MVLELHLPPEDLVVLCLGAHPDDIEIGCGGTLLQLLRSRPATQVHWVVLSGDETRREEAHTGARLFLGAAPHEVEFAELRDGFFPYQGTAVKEFFEGLKRRVDPDLVFSHYRHDRHQDHRTVSDLTWNTFRSHTILEYEVPKYDGDLGRPNCYVALDEDVAHAKVTHLHAAFASQSTKDWFEPSTFLGLMRLRGMEARAPSGFAEAFHSHKYRLSP